MAINNLLNMQQLLDPVGQQLQAGLRQQRGQISQDVANRNTQIQIDKDARKQKWADMLYLLGGALKGNDMSKDIALLEQRRQLRTARDNAAKLEKDLIAQGFDPSFARSISQNPDATTALTTAIINQQFIDPTKDNTFTNRKGLRGEFITNSKPSKAVIGSARKIRTQLQQATGFGDVGAVYQFFTALDPGGRVTEGELQISQGASGAARSFANTYNRLLKGDQFDASARQELLDSVNAIAAPAVTEYNSLVDRYAFLAEQNNMPTNQIVGEKFDELDTSPLTPTVNMYDSLPEESVFIGMSKKGKPMFRTPKGEIIEQQ